MKNIDKETIKQIKNTYPVSHPEEINMHATVSQAKQLLLENTKYSHARGFFINNQIKNISPLFWLLQFLCFGYLMWNIRETSDIENIRALFALLVPILTLYMLPELYKAHICNMTELEAACVHSPVKIFASKLMILSISNFVILTLISFVFSIYHQLNLATVLVQGLIPLNIAISISLLFFDFVKLKSPYAMFISTALIAVALTQLNYFSLSRISDYWQATLPVSFIIMFTITGLTLYKANYVKEWYYGA